MDVLLDDEEELLKNALRRFLETECTPARVRGAEEVEASFDQTLWAELGELGWLGLALPALYGGSDAPLTHLGLLFEEAGRALAPVPLHSHTVAALAVADAGNDFQRESVLPGAASGERLLTWAFSESMPGIDPSAIALVGEPEGNGWRLNGEKRFVDSFDTASQCLVVARMAGTRGREGIALMLVDTDADGVTSDSHRTLAGDSQATVGFRDVFVSGDDVLGEPGHAWDCTQRLLERAVVLNCAMVVGASRAAVERAVDYAKERVAFGRPIGAFQAIQHMCANMITRVDGAELLTREATWRLAEGLDATTEVSTAKAFVNEHCQAALRDANQIHGGLAQVKEFDQQLWYRRAAAWTMRLGTSMEHRRTIAAQIRSGAAPRANAAGAAVSMNAALIE